MFTSKMLRFSIAVLVFIALTIVEAHSMIATLELPALVRQADVIALVTVASTKAVSTNEEQLTTFRNELKVEKLIKGSCKLDEPLVVETVQCAQPGQIGWIEDLPMFPNVGEKCVVFLKRTNSQKLEIVNSVQGIWPIIEGEPAGMGLGYKLAQIEDIVKLQQN